MSDQENLALFVLVRNVDTFFEEYYEYVNALVVKEGVLPAHHASIESNDTCSPPPHVGFEPFGTFQIGCKYPAPPAATTTA